MFTQYPRDVGPDGNKPVWIDLCNPDKAEFAAAEAATGMTLPDRAALSEIESSSRLRDRDGVIMISVPMFTHPEAGPVQLAPIGFILSREHIVTIRFNPMSAFKAVVEGLGPSPLKPMTIFVRICDEIVDNLADSLEYAAAELRKLSADTFHVTSTRARQAIRSNQETRARLGQVGRLADGISETRDILLGVGRAVGFVAERTQEWDADELHTRLSSIQHDVASLAEYEVHLADKIQFLLDAMVGLIGIAQNDVFKLLTIVSIVGIPPTVIAGIYGMNFKNMPEYDWTYGYPYSLILIALSALLPLGWFKWRGWF